MRTMLMVLTVALVSSGCASPPQNPHAGHDSAAMGEKKPAHCGMHAARHAQPASSAPDHGAMMKHCAHMRADGQPVRP